MFFLLSFSLIHFCSGPLGRKKGVMGLPLGKKDRLSDFGASSLVATRLLGKLHRALPLDSRTRHGLTAACLKVSPLAVPHF